MRQKTYCDYFAVLGNPQRLQILKHISDTGASCVGDISEALEIEQSVVSHGLRSLLQAHFVTVNRNGKRRVYQANQATVRPLFEAIDSHVQQFCRLEEESIFVDDNINQ